METVVTKDEQHTLLQQYRTTGDQSCRDQVVLEADRLAWRVARTWLRSGLPAEDLLAEARLALLESCDTWDAGRGAAWSTYAYQYANHRLGDLVAQEVSYDQRRESLEAPHGDGTLSWAERWGVDATQFDQAALMELKATVRRWIVVATRQHPLWRKVAFARFCTENPPTLSQLSVSLGVGESYLHEVEGRVRLRLMFLIERRSQRRARRRTC